MNSIELIDKYFEDHSGNSNYIDGQLRLVHQAAKDAAQSLERNESDYAVANLAIARSLISALVDILILYPSHIWDELMIIFHSVDNNLEEMLDVTKIKSAD